MGFKDTKWAYSLELRASECAVLAVVCHLTDDKTHQTYASQKTIAAMAKVTVATVNKALGVLESMGAITRTRRSGVGGYRTTDIITAVITYVNETNIGETNIGDAYVGETGHLHQSDAPPTSTTLIAEEINQIDQPEDQPDTSSIDELEFEEWLNSPLDSTEIHFPAFWDVYPRKTGKLDATKAWAKAIKRAPAQLILDKAKAYGSSPNLPDRQYIPHAATWLNGDRWHDPLPEPTRGQQNTSRGDKNLAYVNSLIQQETQKGIAS